MTVRLHYSNNYAVASYDSKGNEVYTCKLNLSPLQILEWYVTLDCSNVGVASVFLAQHTAMATGSATTAWTRALLCVVSGHGQASVTQWVCVPVLRMMLAPGEARMQWHLI